MKVEEANHLWEETYSPKKALEQGTHYSVPIQIEVEDDWDCQMIEHRSPIENDGKSPLANDYPLEREVASTLTWETFMDTVAPAFPEKPISQSISEDWTPAEFRDAILETLHDTILCGTLSMRNVRRDAPPRTKMDEILDEEEWDI